MQGPIKFDVLGDRLPTLRYFQYRREGESTAELRAKVLGIAYDKLALFPPPPSPRAGVDGNITRYLVRNLSGSIFPCESVHLCLYTPLKGKNERRYIIL